MTISTETRLLLIKELGITLPQLPQTNLGQRNIALDKMISLNSAWHEVVDILLEEIDTIKSGLKAEMEAIRAAQLSSIMLGIFNPSNTDITIITSTQTIPAHSAVVNAWSKQFKVMLESGMRESTSKVIEILHEDHEYVQMMLNYMYSASVCLNSSNALPLLRLATYYQIDSLRDQCCTFLLKNITADNCVLLLDMTRAYMIEEDQIWKEMHEACIKFITVHYSLIFNTGNLAPFHDVHVDTIHQIIKVIQHKQPNYKTKYATRLGKSIQNWSTKLWGIKSFSDIIEQLKTLQRQKETQFYVQIMDREPPLTVFMSDNKTIYDLKCQIKATEDIPCINQEMRYNDFLLGETSTLEMNEISQGSVVQLTINDNCDSEPTHAHKYRFDYGNYHTIYSLCINALIAGFPKQCKKDAFMRLDQNSLAGILRSSDLNVSKEIIVADTLEVWLNHTKRSNVAKSLLVPLIRLEFIDTIDLLNLPKTHPTIASTPGFEAMLSSALTNQVITKGEQPLRKLYTPVLPGDAAALLSFAVSKCFNK